MRVPWRCEDHRIVGLAGTTALRRPRPRSRRGAGRPDAVFGLWTCLCSARSHRTMGRASAQPEEPCGGREIPLRRASAASARTSRARSGGVRAALPDPVRRAPNHPAPNHSAANGRAREDRCGVPDLLRRGARDRHLRNVRRTRRLIHPAERRGSSTNRGLPAKAPVTDWAINTAMSRPSEKFQPPSPACSQPNSTGPAAAMR